MPSDDSPSCSCRLSYRSRSIAPLLTFGAVVLVMSSTVVIVSPYEQAVVTQFGRRAGSQVLGPGLSFKLPWPLARVRRYQTGRVHQVVVGSVHGELGDTERAMLWTHGHGDAEQYLIVAPTPLGREGRGGAGAVGLEQGARLSKVMLCP